MSGQRKWIKVCARTVGMPIGYSDTDQPINPPIKQKDVKRALALRTFWILLHIITCFAILAGNGRTLDLW